MWDHERFHRVDCRFGLGYERAVWVGDYLELEEAEVI